jgi:cytochrome P450
LLIHDPRDIQHVLVDRESNYRKNDRVMGRSGQRMFARGLLTRGLAPHRVRRRLVQPHFRNRVLGALMEIVREQVRLMVETWSDVVDLSAEMDSFSERVLIRALVGELDEATRERLSNTNRARRRLINDAFNQKFPYPHLLPTLTNWRYRQATSAQREMVASLVRAARTGALDPRSLLALMASYESGEGNRLEDDALVEEMVELLTAGFETTRETLTWAIFLMAQHPRCAAALRSEADRVLANRTIEESDLPKLAYTDMFLSEALRLYPPAWLFMRLAIEADVLPSGVPVRPGWKIYMCQYTAHRNARYFPEPERFDPERFSPASRETRPRFAYFPFGGGPRVCVAEPLVRLEAAVVLSEIARRCRVSLADDRPVEPVGAITLRPRGSIRIKVDPM